MRPERSILDASYVEWLNNATLIYFGKQVSSMYMVLDGMFRVQTGEGRELVQLSACEILDELSFVDLRPPSAMAIALMDSSVLMVDRAELASKLQEDVAFADRFHKAVAMLLSDRGAACRNSVSHLGYGGELQLDEDTEDQDEVSPDLLETMSLAGTHFVHLQRRVRDIAADVD